MTPKEQQRQYLAHAAAAFAESKRQYCIAVEMMDKALAIDLAEAIKFEDWMVMEL